MKYAVLAVSCLSLLLSLGCNSQSAHTQQSSDLHEHFRGFDLSKAPRTTDWGDLPEFFEDRPSGLKSFHSRPDVVIIQDDFPGEILYRPDKKRFLVQQDPWGSSALTYFGPFTGDPAKLLKLRNPKTTNWLGEQGAEGDAIDRAP